MTKKKSALVLDRGSAERIYGSREMAQIREITDLRDEVVTRSDLQRDPGLLRDVELIFSGWGAPVFNAEMLAQVPKLEAVFYGAGSIREITPPEFWDKNIPITSSWSANGIPVAEFTEALVILSLKRFWQSSRACKSPASFKHPEVRGAYGAKIGLVSLGMIGRLMANRLKAHDLEVLAYDPFVDQEKADSLNLGVRMVSLEVLFAECEVVSLHAPNLPSTRGMITGALLSSLKRNATFINTARGAVVDEIALLKTLAERPDVFALLDVTYPEPPVEGSPLYTLPNVVLSPHIAGSMGDECHRMGQLAVDQCRKFLAGEAMEWSVTRKMAENMA